MLWGYPELSDFLPSSNRVQLQVARPHDPFLGPLEMHEWSRWEWPHLQIFSGLRIPDMLGAFPPASSLTAAPTSPFANPLIAPRNGSRILIARSFIARCLNSASETPSR